MNAMELCPVTGKNCPKARYDVKFDVNKKTAIFGCEYLMCGFSELEQDDCPLDDEDILSGKIYG